MLHDRHDGRDSARSSATVALKKSEPESSGASFRASTLERPAWERNDPRPAELILRKANGGNTTESPAAAFDQAASGPAAPIPYKREMEQAFGQDFSSTRVHLGQGAAMKSLGAEAATRGQTVAFGSSTPDRQLIAHELAHVVQNRRAGAGEGVQRKATVSPEGSAAELEAERVSVDAAAGRPVQVHATPDAGIHLHRKRKKKGGQSQASQEGSSSGDADAGGEAEEKSVVQPSDEKKVVEAPSSAPSSSSSQSASPSSSSSASSSAQSAPPPGKKAFNDERKRLVDLVRRTMTRNKAKTHVRALTEAAEMTLETKAWDAKEVEKAINDSKAAWEADIAEVNRKEDITAEAKTYNETRKLNKTRADKIRDNALKKKDVTVETARENLQKALDAQLKPKRDEWIEYLDMPSGNDYFIKQMAPHGGKRIHLTLPGDTLVRPEPDALDKKSADELTTHILGAHKKESLRYHATWELFGQDSTDNSKYYYRASEGEIRGYKGNDWSGGEAAMLGALGRYEDQVKEKVTALKNASGDRDALKKGG